MARNKVVGLKSMVDKGIEEVREWKQAKEERQWTTKKDRE